ncbi:hypothetical protein LRD18_05060 [Halorhodospira halochloris]|nr:hypothetical protein [Halorhodospira halochloris]MCG5530243.1 hypothetical protein [Halorhodospira halochloris]
MAELWLSKVTKVSIYSCLTLLFLALIGCGQKAELRLPEDNAEETQ